jgi:hypothetical protein
MERTFNYYKSFASPNPDVNGTIFNAAGVEVGSATYDVSPINDRVYIFEIKVLPEHQRQGYGFAMLHHLAQKYCQPITVIKELHSASSFWSAARQLVPIGIYLTDQLSIDDMDKEKVRWQHLLPQAARLEALITTRTTVDMEPWHVAVGRGLVDYPEIRTTAPRRSSNDSPGERSAGD